MKKLLLVLTLAALMALLLAAPVFAAEKTIGNCPAVFTLHEIGDHTEHPEHHIGLVADLNGNGYLCMKPLANGLHVHVDDVVQ